MDPTMPFSEAFALASAFEEQVVLDGFGGEASVKYGRLARLYILAWPTGMYRNL